MNELDYERGSRAAWRAMLSECLRNLGVEDAAAGAARWVAEREAAVAMLRSVCERYGDNDWPEDMHLADVIEKHLWRNIEDTLR